MKTATKLIAQLDQEASKFATVGIAVGFLDQTEFVFAGQADRLDRLKRYVQLGGEPMGLVGFLKNGSRRGDFHWKVFADHQKTGWAAGCLRNLEGEVERAAGDGA